MIKDWQTENSFRKHIISNKTISSRSKSPDLDRWSIQVFQTFYRQAGPFDFQEIVAAILTRTYRWIWRMAQAALPVLRPLQAGGKYQLFLMTRPESTHVHQTHRPLK